MKCVRLRLIRPQLLVGICLVGVAAGGVLNATAQATRTIRVVTYNIEDDIDGATTPLPGLIAPSGGTVQQGGVLEGIGEENVGPDPAQPLDILALEETTSNPATVAPITNALNTFYNTPGMYAMSPHQATESGGDTADGNGPNAVVYNTTTLQLLASIPVDPPGGTGNLGSTSGEYREVMRYEFAPAGVTPTAANEFYVYVSHYKSGTSSADLTDRTGEAKIIRNDAATNLPAGARVLYVGDYNVTTSGETSYQTILAATSPNGVAQGQGFDPMNPQGSNNINWGTSTTNTAILAMETESATDLRYRDDLQLSTSNVFYGVPGGLALVPGTYHVFGNNGTTPYNGSVGSGSDTALNNDLKTGSSISASTLYQDLTTASDHLPVVADYTLPLPPVAGFSASPTNGTAPLTVVFANSSTGATNYFWSFGDGNSSTISNPTNVYTNAGLYTVSLTAIGSGGTNAVTVTNYLSVVSPTVAGFSASPTNGTAPLTVQFLNSTTGATNYAWAFGDGNSSTLANPANTYSNAGLYSVTLTATGPGGSSALALTNYISVVSPTVAGFSASPTNGIAPLTVQFLNSSTGATNYVWTFGDGNTSTLASPANTYSNAGLYSVTLTATGPGGSSALTLTNWINVAGASLPPILLGNPVFLPQSGFQFTISNADGTPVTLLEQAQLTVFFTTNPALSNWTALNGALTLSNGVLQVLDSNALLSPQGFYRVSELP
jgi:PKD repeat protein